MKKTIETSGTAENSHHSVSEWTIPSLMYQTRNKVIKHFSCSTQLSTKIKLLIKTKILINEEVSCFKFLRCCIYHANKC